MVPLVPPITTQPVNAAQARGGPGPQGSPPKLPPQAGAGAQARGGPGPSPNLPPQGLRGGPLPIPQEAAARGLLGDTPPGAAKGLENGVGPRFMGNARPFFANTQNPSPVPVAGPTVSVPWPMPFGEALPPMWVFGENQPRTDYAPPKPGEPSPGDSAFKPGPATGLGPPPYNAAQIASQIGGLGGNFGAGLSGLTNLPGVAAAAPEPPQPIGLPHNPNPYAPQAPGPDTPYAQQSRPPRQLPTTGGTPIGGPDNSPFTDTVEQNFRAGGPTTGGTGRDEFSQPMLQAEEHAVNTIRQLSPIRDVLPQALTSGQVPPQVEQGARQNLAAEAQRQGVPPQTFMAKYEQMSPTEKILLWGGLGLGTIGLLTAMHGRSGLTPWLLGALGLGTAAFAGGRAGMLGEGMKSLTGGISDMVSGQNQMPQIPATAAAGLGSAMGGGLLSPEALVRMVPQQYHEQLDRMLGVGNWGNQVLGWGANLMGTPTNVLNQFGVPPAMHQAVIDAYRRMRGGA